MKYKINYNLQNDIHHIINYNDSTNPLVSVIIPTTYKRKNIYQEL